MGRLSAFLGVLAVSACTTPTPRPGKVGVVLMAHGGDAAWNAEIERAVTPLRARHDLEIAYGMAECATLRKAAERLEARGATTLVVVRLFVRSESFLERIQYLLGLRAEPPGGKPPKPDCCIPAEPHDVCVPLRSRSTVVLTSALDGDALLGPILAERAAHLSKEPEREAVLILSHGLGDDAANERLKADIERLAAEVRSVRPFRTVVAETLREDWPEKRKESEARLRAFMEQAKADGVRILVIPYRVAGFGPYKEILEGWDYVADGRGFLPHPNVSDWIERQILNAAR